MCGPYVHWTKVGAEIFAAPDRYNTHNEIHQNLLTPLALAGTGKKQLVPVEETPTLQVGIQSLWPQPTSRVTRYALMETFEVVDGGIRIRDGEPIVQAGDITEVDKLKLRHLAQKWYPNAEALCDWIEKHYAKNGDEDEWRNVMPEWLNNGGRGKLLKDEMAWSMATRPRFLPQPTYASALSAVTDTRDYGLEEERNKSLNQWGLDEFKKLFVRFPNRYWADSGKWYLMDKGNRVAMFENVTQV